MIHLAVLGSMLPVEARKVVGLAGSSEEWSRRTYPMDIVQSMVDLETL